MPRIRLTKSAIDALPTPKSDFVYWDAASPGFGVKVTPTGRKVFVVLYRTGGAGSKLRKYTIGPYGRVTLHQPRVAAQKVFAAKLEGRDPAGEKGEAKRRIGSRIYWRPSFLNVCHRIVPPRRSPGCFVGRWESPGPAGAFMRLASEMWLKWSPLLNSAGLLPPPTRP